MSASFFKQVLGVVAASAAMFVTMPATAGSSWNFGNCVATASNQQASNSGTYGNSWKCGSSDGGGFVTASAWGGENSTGSTGYKSAYLSPQGGSGFGVASRYETVGVGSPNHSMDNDPSGSATPDMILLKFDNSVMLNAINVGWWQGDADMTMMAYTGTGTPTIASKTASNLGWNFVKSVGANGNSSTAAPQSAYTGLNSTVTSSWWLISAYSSSYAGGSALDSIKDYVKLLSVAGNVTPSISVPEPGSVALVVTALVGLAWTRRRAGSASPR